MLNVNVGDWILATISGDRHECIVVGSHIQDDGRMVYRVKAPHAKYPSQIRNVLSENVFAKISKMS